MTERQAIATAKTVLRALKPAAAALTPTDTCEDWCRILKGIEAAFDDPLIPAKLKPTVITQPILFKDAAEKAAYFKLVAGDGWATDINFCLTASQWKARARAGNKGTLAIFSTSLSNPPNFHPLKDNWHAAAVSLSDRNLYIIESEVEINWPAKDAAAAAARDDLEGACRIGWIKGIALLNHVFWRAPKGSEGPAVAGRFLAADAQRAGQMQCARWALECLIDTALACLDDEVGPAYFAACI